MQDGITMPILIMAMVTAYSLDNREISFKRCCEPVQLILTAFAVISLFPQRV